MKITTVLGARPQFIKAAPVSAALRAAGIEETIVHTGQHYDPEMSQVFFDEMGIPAPGTNLGVGSGSHGAQTGRMLEKIEGVLLADKPEVVLVYGDTNSTLAGALAAVKLHIPVAHVEAGLRSFNRQMPEEHNRVLTDHCADLLFCPIQTAVDNLRREGLCEGVHLVGDTMYDAVRQFGETAKKRSRILTDLGLAPQGYLLATVHRPYNTDVPETLAGILRAFEAAGETVVFPAHPRTRGKIEALGVDLPAGNPGGLRLIPPVGYLDMLRLAEGARMVLTDSGGLQKEAFFLGVPCLTLRPETEWVETVAAGWNRLVGADPERILAGIRGFKPPENEPPRPFGDGRAAEKIAAILNA